MLIDRFLPRFDVTYVCETSIDAVMVRKHMRGITRRAESRRG